MIILRNQYHPGGVLTDPSYARLVEEYTGRSASVDERTRPEALQELLYNKSPEHLYSFLTETDTSYVLMTREMRTARFKRSDQGILFVLENSERFVKIEDTSETTLWYFIRK
jgi:hypothetical protein